MGTDKMGCALGFYCFPLALKGKAIASTLLATNAMEPTRKCLLKENCLFQDPPADRSHVFGVGELLFAVNPMRDPLGSLPSRSLGEWLFCWFGG